MRRSFFGPACGSAQLTLLLTGFLALRPEPIADAVSGNAVGYVNVTLTEGCKLIGNPLSKGANRLAELLKDPSLPDGTRLIKFDGRDWLTNEWWAGAWNLPDMTLSPGEAALVLSPRESYQTWAGRVPTGELKVFVPAGLSLRSSMVPQEGLLSADLGFPRVPGTKIFRVDASGTPLLRATATTDRWEPEEPRIQVGEGLYIEAPEDFVWVRIFTVIGAPPPPPVEFTAQPQSQQIKPGDTLTLTAQVDVPVGTFAEYQWQLNGNDILNATQPTLTIPNASAAHLGSYWVRVTLSSRLAVSELARVELASAELPRLAIQRTPGASSVTLSAQHVDGRKFAWEFSMDLVNWSALSVTDSPSPPAEFLDSAAAAGAMRFYRVRLQ
jgi:hypothetical protein